MASLNTLNPNALRYFINETLYSFEITPVDETAPIDPPTTPAYAYLGENRKNFLFILENQQHSFFSEAALDAFSKTIMALGLTMADIAVYNLDMSSGSTDIGPLLSFFNPKKLVFSGVSPLDLGLTKGDLNVVFEHGNSSCLFTYSFEEMLTDTQKKKLFWTQLKTL